jgi:4-cresol dehydrogenase (hydroxylating)
MACYLQLADRMHGLGYYSYRLGIQSMAEMETPESYLAFLQTIKNALDPRGVLAPGRYEPARRARGAS